MSTIQGASLYQKPSILAPLCALGLLAAGYSLYSAIDAGKSADGAWLRSTPPAPSTSPPPSSHGVFTTVDGSKLAYYDDVSRSGSKGETAASPAPMTTIARAETLSAYSRLQSTAQAPARPVEVLQGMVPLLDQWRQSPHRP
jgi:hypothetical protein